MVHAQSDSVDLCTIKPNAQFRINPHPTYHAFSLRGLTKEQARQELRKDPEEKLLLFFGFVREYKGLRYLIQAIPFIKKELDTIRLMIVGAFGSDKEEYFNLIHSCGVQDCVEVIDGYTPDNEVEKYFVACDLVILPYESATQSGIVQIAYGFEKPVIVTNVGGLPDVVIDKRQVMLWNLKIHSSLRRQSSHIIRKIWGSSLPRMCGKRHIAFHGIG